MASSDPPPQPGPPRTAEGETILTDPLRALPWIAALGVTALVVGRFVAPALPGAIMGAAGALRTVELVGGALSQLFAFGAILALSTTLIAAVNSSISIWLRLTAMGVSAYTSLVVLGGALSRDRVPEPSALIAAALSGTFAILAASASRRSPVTRVPAVLLGLVGASTILRAIIGFASEDFASRVAPETLLGVSRALATAASLLVAFALLLSLVHIGRSARANEDGASQSSLWSPITLGALVLAILCARQAVVGASPDASAISVILKRASDRFLVAPEPHLRMPVRLFFGFLTPITAAALLLVRRLRALAASLCLALIAADIAGAPLGGVALVLASMGILLVAQSGPALWSTLVARPVAPSRPPT
ncbi:MAG: hypothetical protein U0441_16150 [Polyangiaceae bacterium]